MCNQKRLDYMLKLCYTNDPNQFVLQFGVTRYYNVLLVSSIFINKSSTNCSDIIEHK